MCVFVLGCFFVLWDQPHTCSTPHPPPRRAADFDYTVNNLGYNTDHGSYYYCAWLHD